MFGKKVEGAAPMSGAEMMLRSMGMGEILDMAKSMASAGTFEKILEFANKADEILATNKRLEAKLDELLGRENISDRNSERVGSAEPGPGHRGEHSGPLLSDHARLDGPSLANGHARG